MFLRAQDVCDDRILAEISRCGLPLSLSLLIALIDGCFFSSLQVCDSSRARQEAGEAGARYDLTSRMQKLTLANYRRL